MRYRLLLATAFLGAILPACAPDTSPASRAAPTEVNPPAIPATSPAASPTFGRGTAILDNGRESVLIEVEVADSPEQKAYGLMHRKSLPRDYGMMFLNFEDVRTPFYMKNTLIPLSVAFFDSTGTILEIIDMTPCRKDPCKLYTPRRPYRGALEVARGSFLAWDVGVGDSVRLAR